MSSAYTVKTITIDLTTGPLKTRDKALDDLNQLLSRNNVAAVDLSELGDKAFHDIFEGLFKTVLEQKPKYFDKKTSKPAELRLNKCARAVRAAASRGAPKLKQKTLSAIIDHITQVLPGPGDGYVRPLLNDYVKALTEILSRAANVEYFSRKDGHLWQICVDFYLDIVSHCIPQNGPIDQGLIGRNSPAPSTPRSTLRSNSGSLLSQKLPEIAEGEPARDALEGLLCLVSAPNAHILSQYQDIASVALRVLRLHNLSLGSLQTMSFAIVNAIISATQLDDPAYTGSLVQDLLPLMAHWWRADKVSQDDTIKSLRNEILRTILLSQPQIEHLAVNKWDDNVREDVVYLLEPLWQEYSKRSSNYQLQLGDITFATKSLPTDYLQIGIFGLNPLNMEAEGSWGIVQCIAALEAILGRQKPLGVSSQRAEQPRKRRRVDQANSRLRIRLKDRHIEIVYTALQVIPFILATGALVADEIQDLLSEIIGLTTHKDTSVASWALIACSSCLKLSNSTANMIDDWKQLWQVATRAISLQSTCRAACLLIHSILETDILPHHSLTDDINSIITTADVNGPATLCDTSITLMHHLLYLRNTILPSASQATSSYIIRWALWLWNPADTSAFSSQGQSMQPINLVNLLRACCGMKPVIGNLRQTVIGGVLCETWKLQKDIGKFNEYHLLLNREAKATSHVTLKCHVPIETTGTASDSNTFFPSKKLLLELIFPKFEELSEICTSWSKKPNEGGSQISQEKFESLLFACIVGAMLLPEISFLNSSQSALVESLIMSNTERGITQALASVDANALIQQLFRIIRPCIPDLTHVGMERLHGENEALLRLLIISVDTLNKHNLPKHSTGSYDMMELDDEFESQSSRGMNLSTSIFLPRSIHQVCLSPTCFYADTRCRLNFLVASQRDESQVGLVPGAFIDQLIKFSDEELLACYKFLIELFSSDLVTNTDGALAIIQRLGEIVGSNEYRCCEVAFTTCVEVMHGLCSMWLNDGGDLSNSVGDLYHYFIQTCLDANFFSPRSLKALSVLLFTLLRLDPGYGTSLKLDSCRTSLLFILREGSMDVKYFVAERIADLFELYILMLHDEVFVDVLGSLPADPESEAGIACRLLALSNLAQRWPTLLRRCTYHIFETPGKISSVSEHARRCIADISRSLNLESPKELFGLFTRQLLYTWMESDSVEEIPFAIFGFESLSEMLTSAQSDAIGLSTMRGQNSVRNEIARHIGKTEVELLQTNFAATISYSTVFTAAFEPSSNENGEVKIKKKMGNKIFTESIYSNFVDIVAFFFDIIDQEDAVEKVFARSEELAYAAKIYKDITRIAHSDTKLPPNQQPMFRAKRASAAREHDLGSTLLSVFENIDDPDAYYGLAEEASLSNVLSRITYENDGMKSVAFLGAQFDNHIRLRNGSSTVDVQALVGALSSLGLSGLAHSLQQTQQTIDTSPTSTENTFKAAQRLEIWNLPAPKDSDSFAVTTYKAYQAIHNATEIASVRNVVYDGFAKTVGSATGNSQLMISALRNKLGTLAALSELDDLMNVTRSDDLTDMLGIFHARGDWMKRGRYEDVSNILSCRSMTMSMLSQHSNVLQEASLSTAVMRKAEVESLLLSSGLYRFHEATQECLNIATSLSNLIPACRDLDLHVDASVNIEVANSLWDQGEMSTAIQMLQAIDAESALNRQAIPVTKADLLAKIGDRLSVARREKPRDIQKKYLEPALKEIGSTNYGTEAGLVFHQFALFCDGQLQDADGLEDLERLQNLRKAKSDEVSELKELIASTKESQLRKRYDYVLSKEKQWLELDEQELRRVEQTRSEFVRLSVENYLLSLIASDAHNNDALRFTALWLERSGEEGTNKAVARYLSKVPTRKFANLMNQLTSRLQYKDSAFQKLLLELVYNICVDHPYHGMYQIWSGTKVRVQSKDEVAVQRVKATEKVAQRLATTKPVANIWLSIEKTSKYYHGLAVDRDANKYKAGAKFSLKDSQAGLNLVIGLAKYHIPPPTMHVEIRSDKDYSTVPTIAKLEPAMTIAGGVSAPKIITAIGTDGKKYKQLVKGGHDDLRQDAIMEQVFAAVSSLLKHHRSAQQRNLGIRTYKVLPLTATSGLIEFVPNTIPLHEFLMPAHERYYPKDLKGSQCRKEIFNVQNRNIDTRISTYRKVTDRFHPVMKYFFMEYFEDPDEWYAKRLAYTRTTAATSILGHILGLGDRHGHNILLDKKTGEVVHIDLGVAFEAGRILPVPELVPFRLTRDIIDGMGISKTEGVFRRCCEFTLDALREEQYSIMTILDVLRYDPLYTWSISPLRLAKLQKARDNQDENVPPGDDAEGGDEKQDKRNNRNARNGRDGEPKAAKNVNEPSEADRALEVVRKKLSKALSVTATVSDLINQATDERNLAVLYSGWAAYA
ncbi:hypothetical protein V2A60_008921 [Cordyceps javanica]|uniref:Serine/threonine-protein kinase Tel1 n=1 Tax=Cordyceps javanica TaxID=43265 RepID=A0A545VN50_9HYPO|nr:ataxia telangiectasia mutated [Cordyceps javanica]TQW03151.1 ataxia telangiectasia mutated [Cordyceps javanica]